MKNEDLHQIIQAVPEDVQLDYDGDFKAKIVTADHIFECQYTRYENWFGNTFFNIESGLICDAEEGKEIETTKFQSKMICELFRPLLHDSVLEGVFS